MPSESKPQQRLMRAAAHTPAGYGGVPRVGGRDLGNADKRTGTRFAAGGSVMDSGDDVVDNYGRTIGHVRKKNLIGTPGPSSYVGVDTSTNYSAPSIGGAESGSTYARGGK